MDHLPLFSRGHSCIKRCLRLSGTKIASQNRSDHGGRKRARSHSAAEITGLGLPSKSQKARSDHGRKSPQPRDFAAAATTGRTLRFEGSPYYYNGLRDCSQNAVSTDPPISRNTFLRLYHGGSIVAIFPYSHPKESFEAIFKK